MLALRTLKDPQIGMGGTMFDPGQHHAALTFGAAWPFDGKQGWVGTSVMFGHVMLSPCFGGSATGLSVTDRCRGRCGDGTSMRLRVPSR